MPEALSVTSKPYMKAYQLQNNATYLSDIGCSIRRICDDQLCAHPDGAYVILFKNIPFSTAQGVDRVVRGTGYSKKDYSGGTGFREEIEDNDLAIYHASAEDKRFTIEFHNEMSYLEEYPSKLIFACLKAGTGGESPFVANRDIVAGIHPKYIEKVLRKQLRYSRNLYDKNKSDYITWQLILQTECKEEAMVNLRKKGMEGEWSIHEEGTLRVWNVMPGVTTIKDTGEELWFNQITANHGSYYVEHPMYAGKPLKPLTEYPYHVQYGDGEELEEELLSQIRAASWRHACAIRLQPGDLVVFDNRFVQHGRMHFDGDRLIAAVLLE